MDKTKHKSSPTQQARARKKSGIMVYLKEAFKSFACPVYLFGSYATGKFHGYSDVDILVVSPEALAGQYYREACDKMSDLDMDYDILMTPSINKLDSSIIDALQPLNNPGEQYRYRPSQHSQAGLTLIEIMIAMLIGVFLIGGVLQVFVSTKQTYRMQENLSRLQENGRFAMDFITRDIRMADYRECATNSTVTTAIAGTNDLGLNASDTITLTWATSACGAVAATTSVVYTIATGAGGLPSLFRNINGTNSELIEGIENMQILYGADTNADRTPDYYVTSSTAGLNMASVISVHISLLLSSIDDNLTAQPSAYIYNGATIIPADRRVRRVFTSTIALRNRLP